MEWINEPPQTEGWYWFKNLFSRKIVEIFRDDGPLLLYSDGIETDFVENAIECGYRFSGPIRELGA